MPKLVLTHNDVTHHSVALVSSANSQRPNEVQTRQMDQVIRRLPPEILTDMTARGLVLPPRELDLLLARLKSGNDIKFSIAD